MIYPEHGYPHPYVPGDNWRRVDLNPIIEAQLPPFKDYLDRDKNKSKYQKEPSLKGLTVEQFLSSYKKMGGDAITAEQIMTRSVEYLFQEDLLEVAMNMFYTKKFRHIPVLDSEKKLVGIVSDRGIARLFFFHGKDWDYEQKKVKEVMVSPVFTARRKTLLSEIAQVFVDERIGAMPILSSDGDLIGILTRSDLLRTMIKVSRGDLLA